MNPFASFDQALVHIFHFTLVAAVCFGAGYYIFVAWLDRMLAGWEVMVLIGALVGFAGLTIRLSETGWFYVLLLLAVSAWAITVYVIPEAIAKRHGKTFLDHDMRAYQKALDFDPNNIAAYVALGDAYLKQGDVDQAIVEYEKALELDPKLIVERGKLEHAKREKALRDGAQMFCFRCLTPRVKGADDCLSCGRKFSFDETIRFNLRHEPRQIVTLYAAVLAIVAILFLVFVVQSRLGAAFLVALISAAAAFPTLKRLAKWD